MQRAPLNIQLIQHYATHSAQNTSNSRFYNISDFVQIGRTCVTKSDPTTHIHDFMIFQILFTLCMSQKRSNDPHSQKSQFVHNV